jgi:hypothetical protein
MAIFRRKTAKKQQRANKRNTRRQRGGMEEGGPKSGEKRGRAEARDAEEEARKEQMQHPQYQMYLNKTLARAKKHKAEEQIARASAFGAASAASASSTSGARGIIDYKGVHGQEIPTEMFLRDDAKQFTQTFFYNQSPELPKEILLIDAFITLIHVVDGLALTANKDDGPAQFSEKYLKDERLVAIDDPRGYMHTHHAFNAFLALKRFEQLIRDGLLTDQEFAELVSKFVADTPETAATALKKSLGQYLTKKFKDTTGKIKEYVESAVTRNYEALSDALKTPEGRHSIVTKCLLAAGGMYALGIAGVAVAGSIGITAAGAALGATAFTGFYVAKYGLLLSSYTVTAYGVAILGFFTAPMHVFYPIMAGLYAFNKKHPLTRETLIEYLQTLGNILYSSFPTEKVNKILEYIPDTFFDTIASTPATAINFAKFINAFASALTDPGMQALEAAFGGVREGYKNLTAQQLVLRLKALNPAIAEHIITTPPDASTNSANIVVEDEKNKIQELFDGLVNGDPMYKETMELTGGLTFLDVPEPSEEETTDYHRMISRLEANGHSRAPRLRALFGPVGEHIVRPEDGGGGPPADAMEVATPGVPGDAAQGGPNDAPMVESSGGGRRKRRRNTRNKRKKNRGSNRKRTKNNRKKNKSR